MREIKFRAWDNHRKKMMSDFVVSDGSDGGVTSSVYLNQALACSDYKIMQFTGLKDKNGVEIYEGDILKLVGGTCSYIPCGIYPNQNYKIGDKMIVQSLLSGFTLCGLNMFDCQIPNRVGKVDNYTFWNHQSSLLVIGNIYEHKHLLQ